MSLFEAYSSKSRCELVISVVIFVVMVGIGPPPTFRRPSTTRHGPRSSSGSPRRCLSGTSIAEVAQAMVDQVNSRAAKALTEGLDDTGAFLHAVEQDLRAVSDDKHIGLWPERLEDVVEDDTDYTPADSEYVEHLRRTNYGYKKIEILPGNVGYLRIDEFAHPELGGPTTIAVMNTVGHTDALIVDLGGTAEAPGLVDYVCGYFFRRGHPSQRCWERASGEQPGSRGHRSSSPDRRSATSPCTSSPAVRRSRRPRTSHTR